MHSLATLNNYSGQSITFSDDRPIDIKYLYLTTQNKSITIDEDETHPAQLGNDIVEFINCDSGNVVYRINVAAVANTTVTWGSLPSGITSNSSAGVYSLYGLTSVTNWDQVKQPTITLPPDYSGVWTYTSSILLNGNVDASWTTTVSVTKIDNLSSPSVFYYSAGNTQVITGTPVVQDTTSSSYTLITSISNPIYANSLTVTGSGGTVTSNTTTKTITITASRTQINGYLANLTITTPSLLEADFYINYSLFNPVSSIYSNVSQGMGGLVTNVLTRGNVNYYTKNTIAYISNSPRIDNPIGDNAGKNYLLKISPTTANCVSNIFATSTFSNVSYYSGNVTLDLYSTKVNINKDLGNIFLTPFTDKEDDFILSYGLFDGNVEISRRNQNQLIDTVIGEIDNITLARNFVQNTPDYLFASNIPEIVETPAGTPSYTLNFSSNAGEIGLSDSTATNNYSFTGTKAECNAFFPLVKFYPNRDLTGNQTFTYTQSRDGNPQLTITVALIGSLRLTSLPDQTTYTFTDSTNFIPTYTQAKYLNMDILLVGGGGAGSFKGGGGGGGEVKYIPSQTIELEPVANPITVGTSANASSAFGFSALGGWTANAGATTFNVVNNSKSPPYDTYTYYLTGGTSGNLKLGGNGIVVTTSTNNLAGGGGAGQLASGNAAIITSGQSVAGNGGAGIYVALTNSYYGGGGGGANSPFSSQGGSLGGIGGGGAGGYSVPGAIINNCTPTPNTGGGAGAPTGNVDAHAGSSVPGASGIVVVRFYR